MKKMILVVDSLYWWYYCNKPTVFALFTRIFFPFFLNWRNAIFPIPVEKKIKPIRTFLVCFYFHKGDWPSGNGISPSTSHGKFCWGCCCLVMDLFLPDMDLLKYQLTGEYLFTFSALLAYAISSLMKLWKKLSEYRKSITISVICENLRPIYRIVSFLPLSSFAVFDGCCFTMRIMIIIIIISSNWLLLAKHCTNFSNKPTLST